MPRLFFLLLFLLVLLSCGLASGCFLSFLCKVANILACCPNARALFVSATISDEAKETIQSLMKVSMLEDKKMRDKWLKNHGSRENEVI